MLKQRISSYSEHVIERRVLTRHSSPWRSLLPRFEDIKLISGKAGSKAERHINKYGEKMNVLLHTGRESHQ